MRNTSKSIIIRLALLSFFTWFSCEDFLNTEPYGTTTYDQVASAVNGAETLLIAAYSNLDGAAGYDWTAAASNWIYGSITGGDAYKGSDPPDQSEITPIEIHSTLNPQNRYIEGKWITYYNGIARANDAIKAFIGLQSQSVDPALKTKRLGEARFLRGFYHFELYKNFGKVPYLDETVLDVRIPKSEDILEKIKDDLLFASTNLPSSQLEPGRITKEVAYAYLGIIYMWPPADYHKAKDYFDLVIASGKYELAEQFYQNFNADFRNATQESILEVQQSINDGSNGNNGNYGNTLNYPWGIACCDFHKPSQNLVNAFKTGTDGLPLLDNYNQPGEDVTSDEGYDPNDDFIPYEGTLDPRLDWTVGRRGIPYFDYGIHPGGGITRNNIYGTYSVKKYVLEKNQTEKYQDKSGDGWGTVLTANNFKLLRYADVLLYAAEAEVELGNLADALTYVNKVRQRAANPDGFVKNAGVNAANYHIMPYSSFADQEYARKAIRFERRIELAMEGHRFYDLVRWGIAAEEKNKYFEKEKIKRVHLSQASFKEGRNEVLPIPQRAIDLSYKGGKPTLEQNLDY